MEHFVQFVHYIAWPIVVLIVFFNLKTKIENLIDRIKKGRIVGIFEWDTIEEQELPTPSQPSKETVKPTDLSKEAKKILVTLWKRQTYYHKGDFSKRWSFRVIPDSNLYGIFIQGFAELLKLGFAGWTRDNGQAVLTNEGIAYLEEHKEIQDYEDTYRF